MPAFALGTLLDEMAEMLLAGQRAMPQRAMEKGFVFRFQQLSGAFDNLFD